MYERYPHEKFFVHPPVWKKWNSPFGPEHCTLYIKNIEIQGTQGIQLQTNFNVFDILFFGSKPEIALIQGCRITLFFDFSFIKNRVGDMFISLFSIRTSKGGRKCVIKNWGWYFEWKFIYQNRRFNENFDVNNSNASNTQQQKKMFYFDEYNNYFHQTRFFPFFPFYQKKNYLKCVNEFGGFWWNFDAFAPALIDFEGNLGKIARGLFWLFFKIART